MMTSSTLCAVGVCGEAIGMWATVGPSRRFCVQNIDCCCGVILGEILRARIWWQVRCLLARRGTLTHAHHFKIKITLLTVHVPWDSPVSFWSSWSPWWPEDLSGTTRTCISASAAQAHDVEHLPTLSHLKPIIQRLVFIKNASFPLPPRPLAAKLLKGPGGEPLALALDALRGCTGTAERWRNAFIQKEKCDSLGVTYLALTLIDAERPFCSRRSQSSALRGLRGTQRRCNSATFNEVPHNVKCLWVSWCNRSKVT